MATRQLSADTARIQAAQQVLLSPLEYPDTRRWQKSAVRQVRLVLEADHAFFWMPEGNELSIACCDVDPNFATMLYGLREWASRGRKGDRLVQKAARIRMMKGSGVYHESDLTDRKTVERSPVYQDVFRPAGICFTTGMSTVLSEGEAVMCIAFERPDAEGHDEKGLQLLRMLLPAFVAGTGMRYRFHRQIKGLERMLDAVSDALLACNAEGKALHRNRALMRLLASEPERDLLLDALKSYALSMCRRQFNANGKSRKILPSTFELATRSGDYRISGSYLAPELFGGDGVLISIRRTRMRRIAVQELQQRFGLSPRQAEVARQLARGRTNREIASDLAISPHTTKHHVSAVMRKVGAPNRAAIAHRLLAETK